MKAERARILEMLQQGQVTVEQAGELLDALERSYKTEPASLAREPSNEAASQREHPWGGWANFGTSLARQIQDSLSGAFRGLGSGGGTNFGDQMITNAYLERMEDGASLTNFGELTISDDVREELLERKIAGLTNFGSVTGPRHLVRVLEARCHTNFGEFEGSEKADLSNLGRTVLTRHQLENMADGSTYSNLGKLSVDPGVTPELLAQKIARYENLGNTSGPAALLAVLQARCPENLGKFTPTDAGAEDEED